MREEIFGRTNQRFPRVWLALHLPFSDSSESFSDYLEVALSLQTPVDISASPAMFGGLMARNSTAVLIQNSSVDFERATDSRHAADLVQAHLVETLSCLGRSYVDFYFLRSRVALEEAQLAGALETFETARQEGHIRFFGLRIENFSASIGNWQFHDAFDVVSVPEKLSSEDRQTARRMAHQRRAGFILRTDDPSLETASQEVNLLSIHRMSDLKTLGGI